MSKVQTTESKDGMSFKRTKVAGVLNMLVVGDIHLGHRVTPTPLTLQSLYKLLPNTLETQQLDYFIIEGDLFDRLLTNNYEHLSAIQTWMIWLLKTCKEHDICLRVLEGTPSHDMEQSSAFVTFNDAYHIGCDLLYVDDLFIEQNERHGITFLYLPDEWTSPIENCFIAAQRLLHEQNLDKVDFAIMHGAFSYQLPKGMGIPTHDMESWLSLVRYHIFIGHHHDHSQYDRIIAAGSLDRGKHGEEGDKGYIRYSLSDKGAEIRFITNHDAMVYKTLDCYDLLPNQIVEMVDEKIKSIPEGSSIRLRGAKSDNITSAIGYMKMAYPKYRWDSLVEGDSSKLVESTLTELAYTPIHLTKDNLRRLVSDKLRNLGYESEQVARCDALLAKTIGV